jgi:hypothetical protein
MALAAVWSFWSKPYLSGRDSSWAHDWYHWLAWGLSLHRAAQHYPDTRLVTDSAGARVLVDMLGLPFVHVSTALDQFATADPGWWALGKLEAYRQQRDPFVHIDTDVFLWKRLNPALEQADLFAQNPEAIIPGATCYDPVTFERQIGFPQQGWLPEEWQSYRASPGPWHAECCGIFGGHRVDFISDYASKALLMVSEPANATRLATMADKPNHMILLEQFLLTACIEYHANSPGSPFNGIEIRYVFDDLAQAYDPAAAGEAGYTHLAAGAKQNTRACRHLEARVRHSLPDYYERCRTVFGLRSVVSQGEVRQPAAQSA